MNFILCTQETTSFATVGQLMIAAASLIVSIFAYRLAEKISFKKTVKDRQFDLVCQFIKGFSSSLITISYQTNSGAGGISSLYLPHFRSSKFKEQYSYFFQCKNFMVQEDGMNYFNFVSLIGDPFLPPEISRELKKIWYHTERKVNDPKGELSEYIIVSNLKDYENPGYFVPKAAEFKDFEAFYNFINKIMTVTNEWLEKHDASDLKFRDTSS